MTTSTDTEPVKKRGKKEIQEAAVVKVMRTLNIKDFLALAKDARPSALMHQTITLALSDDMELAVNIYQLTATEVSAYNRHILDNMPTAPMVEQTATQASRMADGKIRPAGVYKEQNPADPQYIRQMQVWFNDAALWLAVFSAHESMGIDVDSENLPEQFETIQDNFPPSALMEIALAASEVNPGLPIAEEIQKNYYQALAERRMTQEYANFASTDGTTD